MPIYFWKTYEKYGCFSQWYRSNFTVENNTFNCCEQYMMYQKALLFNDNRTAQLILEEKNPKIQKSLGRRVKNFDEKVWNKHRSMIVLNANMFKFSSNNKLKEILLSTKNEEIFEASPFDPIWGIGISKEDAECGIPYKGENLLGKCFENVRHSLQADIDYFDCVTQKQIIETPSLELIVLTGLPGSGKSTLATQFHKLGYHIINQDTIGSRKKCREMFIDLMKKGMKCVVDRCNHTISQRQSWINLMKKHTIVKNPLSFILHLNVKQDVCKHRVSKRQNHPTLPSDIDFNNIIEKFAYEFQQPSGKECSLLLLIDNKDDVDLEYVAYNIHLFGIRGRIYWEDIMHVSLPNDMDVFSKDVAKRLIL